MKLPNYLKRHLLFIFTALFAINSLAQTVNNQDIKSYKFEIKLSDNNDSIYVKSTVVAFSDVNLILNLDQSMTISSAKLSDENIEYTRKSDNVEFIIPDNGNKTVEITYSGIPVDGLIIGQNKNGKRTFFGDNWPERARKWLSVYDHPIDKATVEFIIDIPNKYQAVANGKLLEVKQTESNKIYHYKSSYPLSTKLMVIGVAEFEKQSLQKYPYEISSFSYPEDKMKVFYDYEVAPAICNFFEKTIDKYPFDKLYNVQSTTKYGGMENAGCIFYDENSYDGLRNNEDLLAHEIAHQWFGNSLSEKDWQHVWLSEGFATFFENFYMFKKYGKELYADIMLNERLTVLSFQRRFPDFVMVPKKVKNPQIMLNSYSYQKGAWILNMIMNEVGEEMFLDIIREFYLKFKYSNANTDDFIEVLTKNINKDWNRYLNPWLYSPAIPKYKINYKYEDGVIKGSLIQTNPGKLTFYNTVDVKIEFENSHEIIQLKPDKKKYNFELQTNKKPEQLIVDPDNKILKGL